MVYIVPVQMATDELVYEGLATDLPDVEPEVADLVALERLELFEVEQERIEASLTALACFGAVDELATRRHRRRVVRALAATVSAESGVRGETA